jgi:hypothetical protein
MMKTGEKPRRLDVKEIALRSIGEARETILSGGDILRTFYAQTVDDELICIGAPGEGEENEPKLIAFLRLMFLAHGVRAYSMVSEVWTSTDGRYSRGEGRMPMEDPNRGEAIMAMAVSFDRLEGGSLRRRVGKGTAAITRNPTKIDEMVWVEDGVDGARVTGRYTMLLPMDGAVLPLEERKRMLASLSKLHGS